MDLDVLAKHARDLMGFKGELEAAMPAIRKGAADAASLADDIAAIKEALGPALAWIAEQQKSAEAAKADADGGAADAADKPEEVASVDAPQPEEAAPAVEAEPVAEVATQANEEAPAETDQPVA